MGKLNIAHHKSYHPYRRDNIERVRQDEEEARLKEAKEEGRMMLADSEARMDLLRQRAGLGDREKKSSTGKNEVELEEPASFGELPTTNGHINLFQDVEQNMVAALTATKKADTKASERGVKLAPDETELRRWYTQPRAQDDPPVDDEDDDKRKREAQRKYKHDPLTAIEQKLASRPSTSSTQPQPRSRPRHSHPAASSSSSSSSGPSVQSRLQRESSERERALALIQRRKKELEGNMTPSTVHNDDDDGYGDVYNRREVQDAHRGRERRKNWERRRAW